MKIYINTDLEGISGIVNRSQTSVDSKEYLEQGRMYLMKEVNAAIQAAYLAGATEVVVNDCHHDGFNMLLEEMDERPLYIQGLPRNFQLLGLDETFDAMFFIGAHAMAGTKSALLDHTISSKEWAHYWLNGNELGEIGQVAAMAGFFKVPLIFLSGDQAACSEAEALLHEVKTVCVKEAYGRMCAKLVAPKRARSMIQEGIKTAMADTSRFRPYIVKIPAEIKLETTSTEIADRMEASGAQRLDGKTVMRIANRIEDIIKF